MSSRPLHGIIFDLDGVLVDSHAAHRKAWQLFFGTIGREVPETELDFILDGRKRCDILRHFLGNFPDFELEEYGRRKDCFFQQVRLDVLPVPGAVRLVTDLHLEEIALGLATSASRSRACSTLKELGLLDCFRAVVTGEDVLLGKPDKAVYRLACDRMEIEPQDLVAVEDAVSGVRAAVGAGLRCIGVSLHESREKLVAAGAAHVVPDLQSIGVLDLESILRGSNAKSHYAAVAGGSKR